MQTLETTKYVIKAKIDVDGIIEKPDIIGAIFGQIEGLLGKDLDLRELQKTGRIGRLKVNIFMKNGKTSGDISIPSSLDRIKTSILAASLETVDRVGPCSSSIEVTNIENIRIIKREQIIERSKVIYNTMFNDDVLELKEIANIVKEGVKTDNIVYFGEKKIPAGSLYDSKDLIIVEGRADILTLLKYGIKNTLSIGGTNIPKEIIDFIKNKNITVFTDGDRGGKLIIRELLQTCKIDFVASPPEGKSVEDLIKKEIYQSLKNKMPINKYIEYLSSSDTKINKNNSNNSLISIINKKKIVKKLPKKIEKNVYFLSQKNLPIKIKDKKNIKIAKK